MKNWRFIFFTLLLVCASGVYAQKDTVAFKPSGKIIARAFIDYSTGLSSNTNEDTGFDITRAFLGYNYKFTPTLEAQVIIDGASGKDEKGNYEVYLRNAYVRWRDYGFDVSVGEIGMLAFNVQEKYWYHRYVLKSFQDQNKMHHSVDVGVTAAYQFAPSLSADVTIANGEGYKKVKKNESTRYALGLTYKPVKNMVLRAYGDIYTKKDTLMRDDLPAGVLDATYKNQYSMALFAGYMDERVSGGVEYSRVFNKGFIDKKSYYGYSAYASVKIAPKWRVYARYDNMDSKSPSNFTDPWNSNDGQLMISGIEFQPVKQLKISPNIRNINPDRNKSEQYLFINLEFNL
ncbi:hypothetical protein [Dysgonomonas sp. 25]|uniref:hypothetical protein n=1 Tax=Dysgonomonas sp. 25 TaxID=2302933 RepID=UPI0013D2526C|nr:hypothetical protein [Dysgonomonas sp. 25]NDV68843.1 hypothetical protein [Dysgonomonas sp. 25]